MSQAIEFDVRLDAQQDIDVTMDATPQCRAELDAIHMNSGGGGIFEDYFQFQPLKIGDWCKFEIVGNIPNPPQLEYKIGYNGEWTPYVYNTQITINSNLDPIFFRGNNSSFSLDLDNYVHFTFTNHATSTTEEMYTKCFGLVRGNLMSLLDKTLQSTTMPSNYTFAYLFADNRKLTFDVRLPATTLTPYCYAGMFHNCQEAVKCVGELPATELQPYCYYCMMEYCYAMTYVPVMEIDVLADSGMRGMFNSCYAITSAANITINTGDLCENIFYSAFRDCQNLVTHLNIPPITSTKIRSCEYMYRGCLKLTTTLPLPATTASDHCYYGMYWGCKLLTTPCELPATTLEPYCYYSMFRECTGITTAVNLPATTAPDYCYYALYSGCSGLTTPNPTLTATSIGDYAYAYMYCNCTSLTTVTVMSATTIGSNGCAYMYYGCTSLTSTGALPMVTVGTFGCRAMFYGCTALATAPESLNVMNMEDAALYNMFFNTYLYTAPNLPATTLATRCYFGMFEKCSQLHNGPIIYATSLPNEACRYMFQNSPWLVNLKVYFTDWGGTNATTNWLNQNNTRPLEGTFKCPSALGSRATITRDVHHVPYWWNVVNEET